MGLKTWLYRGGRPNRVARVLDRGTASLAGRGLRPEYLVRLEVAGRRSGCAIAVPLVTAVVGEERFVVSMLGDDSNWVRNVRAAGGNVTLRHGEPERVRLVEVSVAERAPVLKAYLARARNARAHMSVDPDAPLADFERVAARFPVFRIEPHDRAVDDDASRQFGAHPVTTTLPVAGRAVAGAAN
jgi:hypothetical protein